MIFANFHNANEKAFILRHKNLYSSAKLGELNFNVGYLLCFAIKENEERFVSLLSDKKIAYLQIPSNANFEFTPNPTVRLNIDGSRQAVVADRGGSKAQYYAYCVTSVLSYLDQGEISLSSATTTFLHLMKKDIRTAPLVADPLCRLPLSSAALKGKDAFQQAMAEFSLSQQDLALEDYVREEKEEKSEKSVRSAFAMPVSHDTSYNHQKIITTNQLVSIWQYYQQTMSWFTASDPGAAAIFQQALAAVTDQDRYNILNTYTHQSDNANQRFRLVLLKYVGDNFFLLPKANLEQQRTARFSG